MKENMKTYSVRLNSKGVEAMEKMQSRYESTKSAPMFEKALMMHLYYVDKVAELEKKIQEQQAIIDYLEQKG